MSEMDERQPPHDHSVDRGNEPAGTLLRREREAQGLTLEETAVRLNLRPIVVNGIEQDTFEQVPISAYRRGYIRAYARLLGLDEAAVVAAYETGHGSGDIERKIAPVHTTRAPSRIGAWVFRLFTLLVIFGLIALTLLWWQSREGNDIFGEGDEAPVAVDTLDSNAADTGQENSAQLRNSDESGLPPAANEQDIPISRQNTNAPSIENANFPSSESANVNAVESRDGVSPTAETSTPNVDERQALEVADAADGAEADEGNSGSSNAATGTADAAADNTIRLTFNEESWTEIYDANDDRVFSGLQSPDTEASVEGTPPFRLTIGNASGVVLDYRGETVDLVQYSGGNNVARFTLGD